jgi:hypothetical protein
MMTTISLSYTSPIILGWMLSERSVAQIDREVLGGGPGTCYVSPFQPTGYLLYAEDERPSTDAIANKCVFDILRDQLDATGFHMPRVPEVQS